MPQLTIEANTDTIAIRAHIAEEITKAFEEIGVVEGHVSVRFLDTANDAVFRGRTSLAEESEPVAFVTLWMGRHRTEDERAVVAAGIVTGLAPVVPAARVTIFFESRDAADVNIGERPLFRAFTPSADVTDLTVADVEAAVRAALDHMYGQLDPAPAIDELLGQVLGEEMESSDILELLILVQDRLGIDLSPAVGRRFETRLRNGQDAGWTVGQLAGVVTRTARELGTFDAA